MIKYSKDDDFIIFNPDTLWGKDYISEINDMENFYNTNNLNNLLLLTHKKKF